jgi:acyl-CoA reductase-like NAD-dependent aldehyde dehydrogenase
MKYESFGPIIGIQEVKGDEEAVVEMNNCLYGLTSGTELSVTYC